MDTVIASIRNSKHSSTPWDNWRLANTLPDDVLGQIYHIDESKFENHGDGSRKTIYSNMRNYGRLPGFKQLIDIFSSTSIIECINELNPRVDLASKYAKIEYNQDDYNYTPDIHTDKPYNVCTFILYVDNIMSIFMNKKLGTVLYDDDHNEISRADYINNTGLLFFPKSVGVNLTWHGYPGAKGQVPVSMFRRRRNIIVHYIDVSLHSNDDVDDLVRDGVWYQS